MVREVTAQTNFSEGILVYKVDTIRRIESYPAAFVTTQFRVYKKGDFIRVEKQSVNKFNSIDKQQTVEIRNKEGIYTFTEGRYTFNNYVLFMTYNEEMKMKSTAALRGQLDTYTVKEAGQKSVLLSMPTETFIITNLNKGISTEVQITKVINIPVRIFFDALHKVEGTPLQFTDSQYGWLNKYSIASIEAQSLPDDLFQIDSKLKVMTTEQILKELSDFK
jgi:hypothetical protein